MEEVFVEVDAGHTALPVGNYGKLFNQKGNFDMMRIDNKRLVVFSKVDQLQLRAELEEAFIKIDVKTNGGMYHMDNVRELSPKLAELYDILNKRRKNV